MSMYVVLQDLRDYLGFSGTLAQAQDGLLQDCINRAEGAIDAYTRRNFVGTAGTMFFSRYFQDRVVNQAFYLETDLHTLTSLTLGNGQSVPVGSTWLEPRNAGPPYRVIRLHSQYVYTWNTDTEMQVVGTWGYGTTPPEDIRQAAVRYSAWLFRQKDIGGVPEVSGFTEGGEVQFPRGIPDDVRYLLSPYRSRSGGRV